MLCQSIRVALRQFGCNHSMESPAAVRLSYSSGSMSQYTVWVPRLHLSQKIPLSDRLTSLEQHTGLHYSTITQLHFPWFYITLPQIYFILLDSTLLYHSSTSLYFTLQYHTIAQLHPTWLYITLPWLHFTLLDTTLLYTMALLHSTWHYITLPWLSFTLLDSTLIYRGSTSLYFNLHSSIP